MDCPFWISDSFLHSLEEDYKNMFLHKELKELERLGNKIEADYKAWSEEKLKDVPQCCRVFTNIIKAFDTSTSYWNNLGCHMAEIQIKSLICVVPEPCLKDSYEFSARNLLSPIEFGVFAYVNDKHPVYQDILEYKRIENLLRFRFYCEGHRTNNQRFADRFTIGNLSITNPSFVAYADKRLKEYVEETRKTLNWICTGIEPEKPAEQEPVQLELF